jgi:hypothetical protein
MVREDWKFLIQTQELSMHFGLFGISSSNSFEIDGEH